MLAVKLLIGLLAELRYLNKANAILGASLVQLLYLLKNARGKQEVVAFAAYDSL